MQFLTQGLGYEVETVRAEMLFNEDVCNISAEIEIPQISAEIEILPLDIEVEIATIDAEDLYTDSEIEVLP